ncbi:unnamed protein product [marine sediment metagenome]|uniref:NTP pyrophosphohydrolase MazG putative catalytic core domain-containing protein n=1 Tax=marine sediment metagenome TaxID=412755 RepID=X0UBA9_9ZZZZ
MDIRKEVKVFSIAMEQVLKLHDNKPHWTDADNSYLLYRLKQEVKELEAALINGVSKEIKYEAVDVANFAMMLFDNHKEE